MVYRDRKNLINPVKIVYEDSRNLANSFSEIETFEMNVYKSKSFC